jgi:hypothetical protein
MPVDATNAEDYPQNRLAGQIDYHNRKAMASKRSYRRLMVLSVAATSLTPLLLAIEMIYSPPRRDDHVELLVVILPIAIAVVGAVATLLLAAFRHKDVWALHRMTCESLEREAQLFRFGAGPYAGVKHPAALLVQRCESIMGSENVTWKGLQSESSPPPDSGRSG